MASNFTTLWQYTFSWFGSLLKLKLPIYLGSVPLSLMDIIIGTAGILVAYASIRALIKSNLSLAGREMTAERREREYIKQVAYRRSPEYQRAIEHQEMLNAVHRSQGGK